MITRILVFSVFAMLLQVVADYVIRGWGADEEGATTITGLMLLLISFVLFARSAINDYYYLPAYRSYLERELIDSKLKGRHADTEFLQTRLDSLGYIAHHLLCNGLGYGFADLYNQSLGPFVYTHEYPVGLVRDELNSQWWNFLASYIWTWLMDYYHHVIYIHPDDEKAPRYFLCNLRRGFSLPCSRVDSVAISSFERFLDNRPFITKLRVVGVSNDNIAQFHSAMVKKNVTPVIAPSIVGYWLNASFTDWHSSCFQKMKFLNAEEPHAIMLSTASFRNIRRKMAVKKIPEAIANPTVVKGIPPSITNLIEISPRLALTGIVVEEDISESPSFPDAPDDDGLYSMNSGAGCVYSDVLVPLSSGGYALAVKRELQNYDHFEPNGTVKLSRIKQYCFI